MCLIIGAECVRIDMRNSCRSMGHVDVRMAHAHDKKGCVIRTTLRLAQIEPNAVVGISMLRGYSYCHRLSGSHPIALCVRCDEDAMLLCSPKWLDVYGWEMKSNIYVVHIGVV